MTCFLKGQQKQGLVTAKTTKICFFFQFTVPIPYVQCSGNSRFDLIAMGWLVGPFIVLSLWLCTR